MKIYWSLKWVWSLHSKYQDTFDKHKFYYGFFVYVSHDKPDPIFIPTRKLEVKDIAGLVHKVSLRIAAYLYPAGLIESDRENTYLTLDHEEADENQVHSIQYRIAIGRNKGRKVTINVQDWKNYAGILQDRPYQ